MIKLNNTAHNVAQESTSNNQARSLSLDELEKVSGGARCFVKSWSTSGDADDRPTEEVAFYFNRGFAR